MNIPDSFIHFLRYCVVLLLLFPTIIYALLPIMDSLRYRLRRSLLILTGSVLAAVLLLTLFGAEAALSAKLLYIIGLLPLYGVFHFLTDEVLVKKLFCFLNATMIVTNGLVYGRLLSAPWELTNKDPAYLCISGGICLLCTAVLGGIYWRTLTVKIPYLLRSEPLDFNWRYAVLFSALVSLLFYWATPRSAAVVMTGRVRITTLAFLTLVPIIYLLVFQAFWRIAYNLSENARLRAANELMEMEGKRYEELRAYMNETSALRHDFRQHLLAIDKYAKSGETEKLTEYIRQFTASLADHRGSFAANAAVDAVASHYDQIASSQNTKIRWHIDLPEKLPLAESDFISIFGNLVENAIHAAADLDEDRRSINVSAKMLSDAMLGLTVKNPYRGTIRWRKDGLPKSDRELGGVGLTSVAATVKRYNGALDIETDNDVFTAGVLLYVWPEDQAGA